MANTEIILGKQSGGGIDVTQYDGGYNLSGVAGGSSFNITMTKTDPKAVLVTYLLANSTYNRIDFVDLKANKVLNMQKAADATAFSFSSYDASDEVSISGTTCSVKNKTSGSRLMGAVVIY